MESGMEFWRMDDEGAAKEEAGNASVPMDDDDDDDDAPGESSRSSSGPDESSGEGETEGASPQKRPRSSTLGWLGHFVQQLSSWLTKQETPGYSLNLEDEDLEDSDLWKEWEWIISETEKFVNEKAANEASAIRQELEQLRKTANLLKTRPVFIQAAKDTLMRLADLSERDQQQLADTPLDSNKRSKIVGDVVSLFAEEWKQRVKEIFFGNVADAAEQWKAYEEGYGESKYNKGVIGGMKEVGWQASHGPGDSGLTCAVLGDIAWAFWKTLVSSVRWTLETDLAAEDMESLAAHVSLCLPNIVQLWSETVKNSELGVSREGQLPKKWAQEDAERRKRLEEIKRRGAHARYEVHQKIEVRPFERKQLGALKRTLEMSLRFRLPPPGVGQSERTVSTSGASS